MANQICFGLKFYCHHDRIARGVPTAAGGQKIVAFGNPTSFRQMLDSAPAQRAGGRPAKRHQLRLAALGFTLSRRGLALHGEKRGHFWLLGQLDQAFVEARHTTFLAAHHRALIGVRHGIGRQGEGIGCAVDTDVESARLGRAVGGRAVQQAGVPSSRRCRPGPAPARLGLSPWPPPPLPRNR